MTRALSLKREALTELSGGDLAGVAGGALPATTGALCLTEACNSRGVCTYECPTRGFTCLTCG